MAAFRHSIEALINPFFLCLLGLVIALIILSFKKNTLKIRILLAVILLILLLLSTGWLPGWLTHRLESKHAVIQQVDPDIHWIVVLSGGQATGNGLPANTLLYSASIKRLVEGVRLFRALPDATLVLSGGGYGADKPESHRLKEVSQWFLIPEERIKLEAESINTADQAKALKSLLGNKPFYLVSSAIHLPRAMALFEKQGMKPIAAPTDFTFFWRDERWHKTWLPNANNIVYFNIALHELLGSSWERLMGQQ